MSWEQVYEQWVHEENLEENLKKQLNDLGEDPEKLEDAFMHRWNSVLQVCGES